MIYLTISYYYIFGCYYSFSRLLTWGAGKFGQLGNNDLEDNTGQNIVRYVPPEAGRVVQVFITIT